MAAETDNHSDTIDRLEEGRIRQIVDAVGVVPKLATLAMLDQTPDRFVGGTELCHRLDRAQGDNPGWRFSTMAPSVPLAYCTGTFSSLGLVRLGRAQGIETESDGAKITQLGSELWPTIAGAYVPWELSQPHMKLPDIIGGSQQALRRDNSARAEALSFLIGQKSGVTVTEIAGEIGRTSHGVSKTIGELARLGLVNYISTFRPENRNFELLEPVAVPSRYLTKMKPLTRSIAEILTDYQQKYGSIQMTGLEIINLVSADQPDEDPKIIWEAFRKWMKDNPDKKHVVKEVTELPGKGHKGSVTIPNSQRPAISDFLDRRDQLIHDSNYRTEASSIGRAIFSSKLQTSRLLKSARPDQNNNARTDAIEWELLMLELVPPEGIEMDQLYSLVCEKEGKSIQRSTFRIKIQQMSELLEFTAGRRDNGVHVATVVKLREHIFGSDWADDARCTTLGIDPEIFSPEDATSKKERSRRLAEAVFHCKRCPVRAACLRTAVQNNETNTISGGLQPIELKKLSKVQRARLLETVTIV